ncbi:MAG: hypothetical protein IJG39_08410 [Synergistaceae bacterium]|nr:hypothetical protein [Synergistaceae bacterium]
MAVTILEALSSETPAGNPVKNKSLEAVFSLIRHHLGEIEETRSRGYSWKQIDAVCRELWKADAKCSQIVWWNTGNLVRDCYRAIKTGSLLHGKKASKKSLKYSVELTEE